MSISITKNKRSATRYDIKADELHKAVEDIFSVYCSEVIDNIKIATDDTAEELKQMLMEKSPKQDGDYARSWDWTIVYESPLEQRNAVFNRDHWQRIHLLEWGHQSRNQWNAKVKTSDGKREKLKTSKRRGGILYETKTLSPENYGFVEGRPHVMPTWEAGGRIFVEKVKEAIKDAK